jgi:hypothetical protein
MKNLAGAGGRFASWVSWMAISRIAEFVNVARHEAEPGSEQPGNACGDDKSEARHQDDNAADEKWRGDLGEAVAKG